MVFHAPTLPLGIFIPYTSPLKGGVLGMYVPVGTFSWNANKGDSSPPNMTTAVGYLERGDTLPGGAFLRVCDGVRESNETQTQPSAHAPPERETRPLA